MHEVGAKMMGIGGIVSCQWLLYTTSVSSCVVSCSSIHCQYSRRMLEPLADESFVFWLPIILSMCNSVHSMSRETKSD